MPDVGVHARMGREVYSRLKMKMNGNVFRFGLLGPDPFLFSLPHFYRYSSVMHREHTGEFLLEMARRCRNRDQFSYLAGFLCHYALDSNTHPYIVKLARDRYGDTQKGSFFHIAIEHRLDTIFGIKEEMPPFPPAEIVDYFSASVRSVYGWRFVKSMFRTGYRHIPLFYVFVRDRYGLMHKTFGNTGWGLSMVSQRSRECDGLDFGGFRPLYARAVDDAVKYIKCADDFVKRKISSEEFRRVIGSRSYI